MGKYSLFFFVNTLKNTYYELKKSIVVKLGRSVPGRSVPHEIKFTLFVWKYAFLFLHFVHSAKSYIEIIQHTLLLINIHLFFIICHNKGFL